jgi:hypothetical protein
MTNKIKCYTLFDITKTNVRQRNKIPEGVDLKKYIYQRNTQVNLDTILQVISLRAQPEMITEVTKHTSNDFTEFGFMFSQEEMNYWEFVFEVNHISVFDNEIQFGYLYLDCDNIPMVKCGTEVENITDFLNISPELKNIHFELLYE